MADRHAFARGLAVYVVVLGLYLGVRQLFLLWTIDTHGLSEVSQKLPYWDFTNLWGGAVLALRGQVADLFNVDIYRHDLRALISPFMPDQEWSYPPSFLLLGLPLAGLPLLPAYLVWTFATLLLLFASLQMLSLPLWVRLLVIISPAAVMNVIFGQNGALTAALLLSGLLFAPSRPVIAGILLGLLTVKPQIGLLVPFCLLASGNYRSIVAAAVTASFLAVMAGVVFGWESWVLFFTKTRPMMTAILEAPYPQGYQSNGMTSFLLSRSLGLGVGAAYAVQAVFSTASIAAACWLWRPIRRVDHATRACLTAVLAIVATPYGYVYDAIPLSVAAALFFCKRREPTILLGVAWLYPLVNHILVRSLPLIGVLVPTIVAAWTCWNIWRDERRIGDCPDTAKACGEPPVRSDDPDPCAGSGPPAAASAGYSVAGSAN
ncbi:glycosyltransferase family 87 protein [Rhizobium tumorigenes]|uniref:Glycosyltransferase family 87 protein n=1 Tax=Rhizobium tumorigenes TaxID=2041385 RepID=A0AAF1K3Y2_9HYPH|nr:glycosyltransferase family 87 protein [Rhizobium tumorigenes]WFR95234.1 glycosyltransferase family 87 protein [Rhizobium tumorigenes]